MRTASEETSAADCQVQNNPRASGMEDMETQIDAMLSGAEAQFCSIMGALPDAVTIEQEISRIVGEPKPQSAILAYSLGSTMVV